MYYQIFVCIHKNTADVKSLSISFLNYKLMQLYKMNIIGDKMSYLFSKSGFLNRFIFQIEF